MEVFLEPKIAGGTTLTVRDLGFFRRLAADDPLLDPSHYGQDVRNLAAKCGGTYTAYTLTDPNTDRFLDLYPIIAAYTVEGTSARDVLDTVKPVLEQGFDRPPIIFVGRLDADGGMSTYVPANMNDYMSPQKWEELARDTWADCRDAVAADRVNFGLIIGSLLLHYLVNRHLYGHEIMFFRWIAFQRGWI